ncbi:hypothetical protein [Sphingomonas sp. ERG5]|uniref:hypothetical protein n=1 Tax=Sphingomonas sp. ERG5 TaxID=1381597 RepID=UPI00126A734A|nr:hypothetical protein [Sphingomonas sp. ERG5]
MTTAPNFPIFPQHTPKIPVRIHQNSRSFSRRFPQNARKGIFPQRFPSLREFATLAQRTNRLRFRTDMIPPIQPRVSNR